jgi:hypothetical protein
MNIGGLSVGKNRPIAWTAPRDRAFAGQFNRGHGVILAP